MRVAWSTAKHDSVTVGALVENLAKSRSFGSPLIDRSGREEGFQQTE